MSLELRELYQEIIIDHNRNPRNHYAMEDANKQANGFNPLCGDKLTLYVKMNNDQITDLSFVGCGCAISQASASLMTEAIRGKTVEEAEAMFERFHNMVTAEDDSQLGSLDKLAVLAGVRAYPARVKCATLAWHTLHAALTKNDTTVCTE
ncbi:Fe-S cluster assembly sulfur transfer protein SufU [Legionella dresdenensis]|uniref:Fe-S cluster assembly sulfur transfer protein SufU n=1 Tax=Legionella dresdenensis TaxID=450200 RepID=A0ABV8CHD4_9GAMM